MALAERPNLVNRMVRAARLDVTLYEEVEADETATGQAALVVLVVGLVGGFHPAARPTAAMLIAGMIGGGIAALLGWVIWAYLAYWIGTRLFAGTATPGEMLRTLGFSQSAGVLNVPVWLTWLNIPAVSSLFYLVAAVVWVWVLVAGVIAVRQALDFSTEKAIFTVLLGWVAEVMIIFLVTFVLVALVLGAAVRAGVSIHAGG